MAVLTWKDVDFNPVSMGGDRAGGLVNVFNQGLGGVSASLQKLQDDAERQAGTRGVAQGMKYGTATDFREARVRGDLQMTPVNEAFFTQREADLLAQERKAVETGQAKTDWDQDIDTYADAEAKRAAQLEAAPLIAQIAQWGNSNDPAQRILAEQAIRDPANARLLTLSGYDVNAGSDDILTNMTAELTRTKEQDTFDQSLLKREAQQTLAPIRAEVARLEALGTLEGAEAARQLRIANADLYHTAGEDVAPGITGAAQAAATAAAGTEAAEKGEDTVEARALADLVEKEYTNFRANQYQHLSLDDALAYVKTLDIPDKAKDLLRTRIESEGATLYPAANMGEAIIEQALQTGETLDPARGANELAEAVAQPNPFFNEAFGPDGPLAGYDVNTMTFKDLRSIQGTYSNWVAQRNGGQAAAPLGMFQLDVNTPQVQDAIRELGFTDDTVFDADTQLAIFEKVLNNTLDTAPDRQAKLDALRQQWPALANVNNNTLEGAIVNYIEGGDRLALGNMLNPDPEAAAAASRDPEIFESSIQATIDAGKRLTANQNQGIYQQFTDRAGALQEAMDTAGLDSAVAGYDDSVMAALTKRTPLSAGEIGPAVVAAFNSVAPAEFDAGSEETPSSELNQFRAEVNKVIADTGLSPDVAIEFVKGAVEQAGWNQIFTGNMTVNHDLVKQFMSKFIDVNETDPNAMLSGGKSRIRLRNAQTESFARIAELAAGYQESLDDYTRAFSSADSRVNPGPVLEEVIERGRMVQEALDKLNESGLLTVNTSRRPPN